MSVGIEGLFTSALGLVPPWEVDKVELDTARRRIDFEVRCSAKALACPHCGAADQRIHDRLRRSWRHLDFFQFEAWLHADVPRRASGSGLASCHHLASGRFRNSNQSADARHREAQLFGHRGHLDAALSIRHAQRLRSIHHSPQAFLQNAERLALRLRNIARTARA